MFNIFKDTETLQKHYRKSHYLCEEDDCKGSLIAFDDIVVFEDHLHTIHQKKKQNININAFFKVTMIFPIIN
jgi:hypothetical protein